jgi:DNA polymerase-1
MKTFQIEKQEEPTALIVDGNNYIWRGAYAIPESFDSEGNANNAIKGFLSILGADVRVLQPDYLVVVFDANGGTKWRKKLLPQYKGNRGGDPELRDQVYGQIPAIKEILRSLGIVVLVKKDYEADDTMGTLAVRFSDAGIHALISSTDKDLAQVIRSNVSRVEATTRRLLNTKETVKKFGVPPKHFIEYLMLVGDKSDNVPGVFRCGPKTASKLLIKHGSLRNVLKNKHTLPKALQKNISDVEHMFDITRKVVTICCSVDIKASHDRCHIDNRPVDERKFKQLCKMYGVLNTHKQLKKVLL